MAKKNKTEEEIKEQNDFDKLYKYVKKEVFNFDNNQALPSSIVLGLKGLSTGKVVENKKIEDKAKYPFEVIYLTFIYCRKEIEKALRTKNFKNEQKAFNYISAIVRNNINTVYMAYKNRAKEKELVHTIKNVEKSKIEYRKKSKETKNDKLKGLW